MTDEPGPHWANCTECGRAFNGTICPGCGTRSGASGPSAPAAVPVAPVPVGEQGELKLCSRCRHPLVRVRSPRWGVICNILGLGMLVLVLPLAGQLQWLVAISAFSLVALGMWKQVYPPWALCCPQCTAEAKP